MAIVKVEKNNYTVEPLYQWDLNQVLEIRGLSMAAVPEVHFTNDAMVRAIRRFAAMDATGVIQVEVPNALLQTAAKIRALVCIREGEVFKTYHDIRIPVKPRQQPADYTITDDQDIYSFLELENLVYDSTVKVEAAAAAAAASATQAVNTANTAQQTAKAAAETANGIAATANAANTTAGEAKTAAGEAKAKAEALEQSKATVTKTTATLTAAGWTGDAAPYTQTVTMEGIQASDAPHVAPVYSDALATKIAEKEAWAMVCEAEAAAGALAFTCFEEKPGVDITIQIEVVR